LVAVDLKMNRVKILTSLKCSEFCAD